MTRFRNPQGRIVSALLLLALCAPSRVDASVALEPATSPAETAATADASSDPLARARVAVDAEDWPGAIAAYREAMAAGVEEVDGTSIREVIAKLHFRLGTALYSAAKYEEALRHFQDAQGLFPAPDFHFNIAKCQEELGKYEAAISSYEAFVRGVPDAPASIQARIERLRATVALEQESAARELEDAKASSASPQRRPGRGLILSGATLAAVGALTGTIGGVVFGLQAADRSDQVDAIFAGNPDTATFDTAASLDAEGRRAETMQIVMAATGGVIAVTGAALLAVGLKKKRDTENTSAWRVGPSLTPKRAGVFFHGRF